MFGFYEGFDACKVFGLPPGDAPWFLLAPAPAAPLGEAPTFLLAPAAAFDLGDGLAPAAAFDLGDGLAAAAAFDLGDGLAAAAAAAPVLAAPGLKLTTPCAALAEALIVSMTTLSLGPGLGP